MISGDGGMWGGGGQMLRALIRKSPCSFLLQKMGNVMHRRKWSDDGRLFYFSLYFFLDEMVLMIVLIMIPY